MQTIHHYLPLQYLKSLAESGAYFTPCPRFVDKLEFRYGYIWWKYNRTKWEDLDQYLAATFADEKINRRIASAHISCWTLASHEHHFMWEIYGRRTAAVRISANRDRLVSRFSELVPHGHRADGPVTYDFQVSKISPQFLGTTDSERSLDKADQHLFFHKHKYFALEKEFRFVAFDPQPRPFYLPCIDLILQVCLSPFHQWTEKDLCKVHELFDPEIVTKSQLLV